MACSFVLIAVYMFTKYLKNNSYKNLTLSFLFMVIACYCNTVALIPYATLLIITFIKLVKDKEIFKYAFKHIIFIVPLIVLSILAVIYHFYLSGSNFLYGGHTGFFQDTLHSIPIMIGFNPKYSSIIVNVFLLLYIFIFGYNFKKIKNNYMAYSAIIMFALLIITTFVSKRPWVTGRCLIPMYPIIFISIIEIIETIKFKQIWKSKLLQVFLILPLLFIFVNKYDLYDVREWSDETKYRTIAYKALETKDNSKAMEYSSAPSLEFYRERILYYNKYDIFKR
ncbi:MAG: hypothetical protein K5666_03790 [Bacilli bacterium]|nr:hypothetical protein [Bacilli bacterium]